MALATPSCVSSCVRWVSRTTWKSTRPLLKRWRASSAALPAASAAILQVQQAFAIPAQRDQGVFHVLQGREHDGFVGRLRLVQRGLLRANLGERGAAIEDRHRHAGEQRRDDRRAVGQRAQRERVQAHRAAHPETRQARGIGLRHARHGGRHLVFDGPHVGPLAKRLGGNAQRQVGGRQRHRADLGQHRRQGGGRLTGQHGKRMAGLVDRGLQCGQLRARLLGSGTRLLGFERRDQSGLEAPLRDLQDLQLALEVVVRDREARLGAAQRDVAERDLAGERNLHVVQVRGAGAGRCFARIHGALVAAEDVGLPARIEGGAVALARVVAADGVVLRGGRRADGRQQPRRRDVSQRPRLPQRGLRSLDGGVGRQGLRDEAGEQRIVEAQPPLRQGGGAGCRGDFGVRPGGRHVESGRGGILRRHRCATGQGQQHGGRHGRDANASHGGHGGSM